MTTGRNDPQLYGNLPSTAKYKVSQQQHISLNVDAHGAYGAWNNFFFLSVELGPTRPDRDAL